MIKYFIEDTEYKPINTGSFTLDWELLTEAGAYHYALNINGSVKFEGLAYKYVEAFGDCQKIRFTIVETCEAQDYTIFSGFFTNRSVKWSPDYRIAEIEMSNDTLYDCLTKNYDKDFNFLQTPNIVNTEYNEAPLFEFIVEVPAVGTGITPPPKPFYGTFITTTTGVSPFFGFAGYVRELKTTYCQGGEPQAPEGTGWEVYIDACEAKGVTTWFRKPAVFTTTLLNTDFTTTSSTLPTPPPPPPITSGQDWLLMDVFAPSTSAVGFWVDKNKIAQPNVELKNGRPYLDALNYGINVTTCPELDVQSRFFNRLTNPVTGNTPSTSEGLQLHAISDIKDPDATEAATREDTTVKDLLESVASAKFNCFWYIDEGTKRLIIENYKDLFNQGTFDIRPFQKFKNSFEFDNTDVPVSEQFETFDNSIDFTGVPILYNNPCATGVKNYPNSGFYTEVDDIVDGVDYPNDGIVLICPDSLVFDGARAENGAITGDYRANMPLAMANLQDKFWGFYRPFDFGNMNFTGRNFDQPKPVKALEEIIVENCCFYFFNPRFEFIGNNFDKGQLQSASFNLSTKKITLNIKY